MAVRKIILPLDDVAKALKIEERTSSSAGLEAGVSRTSDTASRSTSTRSGSSTTWIW
jgi:hypothetical protein